LQILLAGILLICTPPTALLLVVRRVPATHPTNPRPQPRPLMLLLLVGVGVWMVRWLVLLQARKWRRLAIPPLLLLVLGVWGWVGRLLLEAAALLAGWPCVGAWQVAVAAAAASRTVLPHPSSDSSSRSSCNRHRWIRGSSSSS
jgi:hypothetical protein